MDRDRSAMLDRVWVLGIGVTASGVMAMDLSGLLAAPRRRRGGLSAGRGAARPSLAYWAFRARRQHAVQTRQARQACADTAIRNSPSRPWVPELEEAAGVPAPSSLIHAATSTVVVTVRVVVKVVLLVVTVVLVRVAVSVSVQEVVVVVSVV